MSYFISPLQIKHILLKNRIVMSPMCQYSAVNGYPTDWHFAHYATRAVGGVGAIIQEATAILPKGRITYGDLGLWEDEQIAPLQKITSFIAKQGAIPGIQLAHAGRKAGCDLPWKGGAQLKSGVNSWTACSASPLAFRDGETIPIALNDDEIKDITLAFKKATIRAIESGYKIIEIHAAHGYLIHQFLSPLSNKRTDEYGGSFENRIRFLLEIVDSISGLMDDEHSLWVRISATDWVEGGWSIDDSVKLSQILKNKGVDVIDTSTGGLLPKVHIPVAPAYQAPFAGKIKNETGILTGSVGLITEIEQIENLLSTGTCDLVLLGRKLLSDPYFIINSAQKSGNMEAIPVQYERAY